MNYFSNLEELAQRHTRVVYMCTICKYCMYCTFKTTVMKLLQYMAWSKIKGKEKKRKLISSSKITCRNAHKPHLQILLVSFPKI